MVEETKISSGIIKSDIKKKECYPSRVVCAPSTDNAESFSKAYTRLQPSESMSHITLLLYASHCKMLYTFIQWNFFQGFSGLLLLRAIAPVLLFSSALTTSFFFPLLRSFAQWFGTWNRIFLQMWGKNRGLNHLRFIIVTMSNLFSVDYESCSDCKKNQIKNCQCITKNRFSSIKSTTERKIPCSFARNFFFNYLHFQFHTHWTSTCFKSSTISAPNFFGAFFRSKLADALFGVTWRANVTRIEWTVRNARSPRQTLTFSISSFFFFLTHTVVERREP